MFSDLRLSVPSVASIIPHIHRTPAWGVIYRPASGRLQSIGRTGTAPAERSHSSPAGQIPKKLHIRQCIAGRTGNVLGQQKRQSASSHHHRLHARFRRQQILRQIELNIRLEEVKRSINALHSFMGPAGVRAQPVHRPASEADRRSSGTPPSATEISDPGVCVSPQWVSRAAVEGRPCRIEG